MQVLFVGEASRLEERIKEKAKAQIHAVASSDANTHAHAGDKGDAERELAAFDDWLHFRFRESLERDAKAGPAFGKASTAIGVTTIGAGLGSSAAAGAWGDDATLPVAALGILVGILTAINQIWRPSQRSIARYQAAFALRREGWDFVQDRGRYERLKPEVRLGALVDEVTRIHRAVESVDEASSPSQSGG